MIIKWKRISLSFSVILVVLALYFGRASAQSENGVRVLSLSPSGYERANSVAFSPNGKFLAIGGLSGIHIFETGNFSERGYLNANTWARSLAFIPGTNTLAGGLFDHTVKFWDASSGEFLRTLEGPEGWVRSISISRDGSRIASASDDDSLSIWEIASGTLVLNINNATGIRAVALSPDGSMVAGALVDNTIHVWSVPSGEILYTLVGHTDWPRCLAFSPDGKLLASGSFDKSIRLWNIEDGSALRTLDGHTSSVLSIAFSPDGQTLASGSVDQTVRLWNVDSGEAAHVLRGHTDFVYSVAFAPDGRLLASGGGDNTARIWDLNAFGASNDAIAPTTQSVSSDCRACHHRRGNSAPARVIDLGCEGCHAGGAGLSWCAAFPKGGREEPSLTAYRALQEVSGLPIAGRNLAVVIASPGNGETLYVKGEHLAPEKVTGNIYYADSGALSQIKVRLDIFSDGQKTDTLTTYPGNAGEFAFNLAINLGAPQASSATLGCTTCHSNIAPNAGLPVGHVRILVTAIAPDGGQASDERWLRVDSSKRVSVPIYVVDSLDGRPLAGISVDATTLLYEWRPRSEGLATDTDGYSRMELESLSQADTVYEVNIPPQVVNGRSYAGDESVQLVIQPGKDSYPALTLKVHSQMSSLSGQVLGEGIPPEGTRVWAFRLPAGPAYLATLSPTGSFSYDGLPIEDYLVFADPLAFAMQGLEASSLSVDLINSPQATGSMNLSKSRMITGKVTTADGGSVPFAWITAGGYRQTIPVNPVTGRYLLGKVPLDTSFLTVSAPGYYSLSKPVRLEDDSIDFQLAPRPETPRMPWGGGEVVLSSEDGFVLQKSGISIENGWLWGSGGDEQPLHINFPSLDVVISRGEFSLSGRAVDKTPWLYLYSGEATITFERSNESVVLQGGNMIALVEGAQPLELDASIAQGLLPVLGEAPVSEVIQPTFRAFLEDRLVKTGIRAVQAVTLLAYILSITALIGIPLSILVGSIRRKNASQTNDQ